MTEDERIELLELTRENHKMLKKMRREQKWTHIGRVLYWVIIIGLVYGSFVWIKPYLGQLQNAYNVILEQTNAVQGSLNTLNNVRKDLKDGELQDGVNGLFDLFGDAPEQEIDAN